MGIGGIEPTFRTSREGLPKQAHYWHSWLNSQNLMARIGNKKAFTIHLSDEMAAMIDSKRKEWDLRSRGEVIERLLGWMVERPEAEQ